MVRRVLALVLLGIALVVCTALAASESLRNRTGSTASAVTVTFSEKVTITGYNSSVFTTQEPTGKAESFRFSGGQLEDGGRFMISWSPSDAQITNTEWEVPAAAAAGPLTYEEIMAQIAQYPGPDEPLYVPAEGEQIWLTDLEGHADIYDNDSIRINYAPGFDKSQITKIEVYRNDIKLRFMPALFDVLTNEQMKTFDGNSAERTPKSSHTDHAIFGYEYQFRLSAASSYVKACSVVVRSPVTLSTDVYVQAATIWWHLDRPDSVFLDALRGWKAMGFDGVQFDVDYFMETDYANTLFAQYTYDTALLPWWERTMTLDEIRRVLRLIREAELKADMRVCFWIASPYVATHPDASRCAMQPRSWAKWFENYTAICVEMARLAEEGGAEYFTPMVELCTTMFQTESVKALLSAVGTVFSGSICVSWFTADGMEITADERVSMEGTLQECGRFWDWRGYQSVIVAGMEWWPGAVALARSADALFTEIAPRFISLYGAFAQWFAGQYPGTSLRFSELGTFNYDGISAAGPFGNGSPNGGKSYDNQEYADNWASFLLSLAYLDVEAVVWSMWVYSDPSWVVRPGLQNIDYTPVTRVVSAILE